MFDNSMTGAVGFAMHEDRLAMATRNLQIMTAEQASGRVQRSFGEALRASVARVLMALAAWIAPTVKPRAGRHALAR